MAKDTFWFKHDYNARNDEKVLELRSEFGAEGYGVFWMLIETMAENENGGAKASLIGGLSHGYGVAKDKLCEIIKYCVSVELVYEKDGFYFSKRLDKHKDERRQFSENGIEGAAKRWGSHKGAIAGVMQRREEEKREEKKKEDTKEVINIAFSVFWDLYDKKVGEKSKLEKKWEQLSNLERELAIKHIPKYKLSQPDKKFRKDPQTYLNNKSFNDEVIDSSPPQSFYTHSNIKTPILTREKEYWEVKYGHLAKTKEDFMKLVAEGKIED
jgi:hypothetical protein